MACQGHKISVYEWGEAGKKLKSANFIEFIIPSFTCVCAHAHVHGRSCVCVYCLGAEKL